jgi:hypothetical protein
MINIQHSYPDPQILGMPPKQLKPLVIYKRSSQYRSLLCAALWVPLMDANLTVVALSINFE